MVLKDITFPTPSENLCYDDVLLKLAEDGMIGEALRFWESPSYFVVLGRISKEFEDLHIANILKDKIPVLRRSSGGGTVLQGPGCLNYSLILNKDRDPQLQGINNSYQYILSRVTEALRQSGFQTQYLPISDIAWGADLKKISGNAQKRGRTYILHHGTILYHFDLSQIEQYLRMPVQKPEYRRNRPHSQFVTNIPLKISPFKQSLQEVFKIKMLSSLSQEEMDCLSTLVKNKKEENIRLEEGLRRFL
jgi:lipoate-protein ligase A